jgi:hypothetical protein
VKDIRQYAKENADLITDTYNRCLKGIIGEE